MRHEHLLGLRALERAERLAVAEDARLVALVVVAAAAEEAGAAGGAGSSRARGRRRPRSVTASPAAITVADELVADHEAGLDLDAPVVDVQVRPADAGRLDAHDRVVGRAELGLGALLDPRPRRAPGR